MSRSIHPRARKVISTLKLPGPVRKHLMGLPSGTLDLTNNTNPYGDHLAEYPPLDPLDLKEMYIGLCLKVDQQKGAPENYSPIRPENMMFTVGALEGMTLMLRAFAEPGQDCICLTNPTFPDYEHWARLANVEIQKVPLLGEDFDEIDIAQIKRINPKLVVLCEPNNPTATQLRPGLIHELCSKIDSFIVVDEAYIEFSNRPSLLPSLLKYPNLVILRTLSKGWGMAGARCGVLFAEETIINTLWYSQMPFGFTTLSQQNLRERLTNPDNIMASWDKLRSNRDALVHQLNNLSSIAYVYKSQANFILVRLNGFSKAMEALHHHGILVSDCRHQLENTIRITITTSANNDKVVAALGEVA